MTPTAVDTPVEQTEARRCGQPAPTFETAHLIGALIESGKGISDLIFSPGRPPQVERHGELVPVPYAGVVELQPEDTARVARDLIGGDPQVLASLDADGAADFSYQLPTGTRFRVNAFRQRGSYAIVMRVIASRIPTIAELRLPAVLADVA